MVTAALIGLFVVVVLAGMPIGAAMIFSSVAVLATMTPIPLAVVPQVLFSGMAKFELLAVPLFILAAEIMNAGGLTTRVFRLALVFIGNLRGSLAQVNILASVIFGGISGAAIADAAGLGRIEHKVMKEAGYPTDFAAAVTLASCLIGPLIPPSITLIVFAVEAQVSVGRMLLAGLLPGAVLTLILIGFVYFLAATGRVHCPPVEVPRGRAALRTILEGLPALVAPFVILGGLVGGWFTATETGVIACLYSLAVAMLIHREMSFRDFVAAVERAVLASAMVMFMIGAASVMSWIITYDQSILTLAAWFNDLPYGNVVKLLLINLFLILIGLVIEGLPAMLIVIPVLLPIMLEMGMDPIQFGVMLSFNFLIGLITPPVGLGLFVMSSITGHTVGQIARACVPFFIPMFIFLLMITFIPSLSTWLPYTVFPQ